MDKPLGMTSRVAIDAVRRCLRTRGVGHTGTLDPLATGVLVAVIGRARRLQELVVASPKVYWAQGILGASSRTDDAEGPIEIVEGAEAPSPDRLEEVVSGFRGLVRQRPPAFSAVRIEGRRAYEKARRGEAVETREREVHVLALETLSYDFPIVTWRVTCSGGTYIRSLARDIGQALGTGAYLGGLRRERVGCFQVEVGVDPENVDWSDVIPIERALPELPGARVVEVESQYRARLVQGGRIPVDAVDASLEMLKKTSHLFASVEGQVIARLRLDVEDGSVQSAGLLVSG